MSQNNTACAGQFVQFETSCEQGVCNVSNGACECNQGWMNIGDFSFNEYGSCDIHKDAVIGLWLAQLVIDVLSMIYSAHILWRRYQSKIIFDRKTWRIGIVPFGQIVACFSLIPVVALKIVDPGVYAVGRSVTIVTLTTAYLVISACCLLSGLVVLMKTSMALLPMQSEQFFQLQKYFKVLKRLTFIIAVLGLILCFSPFIMLFDTNLTYLAAILIGIGIGSMMLLIGCVIATLFLSRLINGIAETLESAAELGRSDLSSLQQLRTVLLKLRVLRAFELIGFFLASVILYIFAFTPFLFKKASYIYPLAFLACVLAVDLLLWGFQNGNIRHQRPSTTATLENNPMRSKENLKVRDATDPSHDMNPNRQKRASLAAAEG